MASKLVWAVALAAAVGCALSESLLFRMARPPDASSALLAGLWVAMPYLAAAGLAALLSRATTALAVLLASLLTAGSVGVFLLGASAAQQGPPSGRPGRPSGPGKTRRAARRPCGRPGRTRAPPSPGRSPSWWCWSSRPPSSRPW
jgi:hypothetical protein